MPTIDFGKAIQDARGASFEALPIGDYDVEVAKAEAVTSQNGKPMVKTTFKVVSGPYEKRPIINQFVLSLENPQATAIFFRHMKAFGLTEEWFASLGQVQSLEPVASALLGRRARLSLGHREWQGETRNEVKAVKPYTGAPGSFGAGPAGPAPTGPGAFTGGPTPPAAAPQPAPVAAPAPPVAPSPPVPTPVAAPAPAAVPDAPPLPDAAQPQVQSVPQPPESPEVPAPVPTPATSPTSAGSAGSEVAASPPAPPTVATSEAAPAASAPPALPF